MARDSTRRLGSARSLLPGRRSFAVEQFVAAEHHDAGLDEAKAGAHGAGHESQPIALRELAGGEHVGEALALRFVVAGDEHAVLPADGVEFVAHAVDVAAEALDRLDAQMADGLDARPRKRRHRHVGPREHLSNRPLDREQPFDVDDGFQVELALLLQLGRLDQNHPRPRRQMLDEVRPTRRSRRSAIAQNHDLAQIPRASLRSDRELPDRFDLVAEELQPHGSFGIEREDVDDAAATGELAGQFARIDALVAVGDEPNTELVQVEAVANA